MPFKDASEVRVRHILESLLHGSLDSESYVQEPLIWNQKRSLLAFGRMTVGDTTGKNLHLREGLVWRQVEVFTCLVQHVEKCAVIGPRKVEMISSARVCSTENLESLVCSLCHGAADAILTPEVNHTAACSGQQTQHTTEAKRAERVVGDVQIIQLLVLLQGSFKHKCSAKINAVERHVQARQPLVESEVLDEKLHWIVMILWSSGAVRDVERRYSAVFAQAFPKMGEVRLAEGIPAQI
mmetsp:Transcript_168692/g.324321  ORF Transcript_168692/g.324321 Transcript_168692/m.324321 type:complete len:239 (+) Transcript_168692:1904-2620(+)